MKTLQNNFTTSEQSKRLLKLGVPADSADCVYTTWKNDTPSITYLFDYKFSSLVNDPDIQTEIKDGFMNIIPCWSVGRLIEIGLKCSTLEQRQVRFFCNGDDDEYSLIDYVVTALESSIMTNHMDFSKLEE